MYKKPVHSIYTGFDNFLHYSLQGFKVYAVLMYTLLVPHRFLVTGDAMTTIAYNFRLGVLTARQIILDVCTALWDALASIHMPVPSEVEWQTIADDFFVRWNFPNCIGAIDGKHIMIQCPEQLWILVFQLQIILFHCVTSSSLGRLQVCYGGYWCLRKQQ